MQKDDGRKEARSTEEVIKRYVLIHFNTSLKKSGLVPDFFRAENISASDYQRHRVQVDVSMVRYFVRKRISRHDHS